MSAVHVVVPEGIRDPARPSGGNTYDRHVIDGLAADGWTVHEYAVPMADEAALAAAVARVPDGALVLLDGLVASDAPGVLAPEADRVRQVVLLHMPLGGRRERAVLDGAAAVVTPSAWSRGQVLELHGLPADRVHVAEPGVEPAALAPGSPTGQTLLCVGAVLPHKGHDVLVDGLAAAADLPWRCACVGSLDRDPAFATGVRRRARERGIAGRLRFTGPRTGAQLERSYAGADLLVLASHAETYGMVVTEALARGLPVVAADVGGVGEALGHAGDGTCPGLLVPPGDAAALGAALRAWLEQGWLRERLRHSARGRRAGLHGWSATAAVLSGVLTEAAG